MKKQRGFTVIEGLLLLVIAGIIGFTGWYVWNSKNKTENSYNNSTQASSNLPKYASIKTFDDCKKLSGSKIQESYPEVCVAANGKSFTNNKLQETCSSSSDKLNTFTSKLEKVSFNYPSNWKVVERSVVKDTEKFILLGCNNYLFTFSTYPPFPAGFEHEFTLHLNKIDVPNLGPLYSVIEEDKDGLSNGIALTDYSSSIKDGDKGDAAFFYNSKRTGKFTGVIDGINHYWVELRGYYLAMDSSGNVSPASVTYKKFATKSEVLRTEAIYRSMSYPKS